MGLAAEALTIVFLPISSSPCRPQTLLPPLLTQLFLRVPSLLPFYFHLEAVVLWPICFSSCTPDSVPSEHTQHRQMPCENPLKGPSQPRPSPHQQQEMAAQEVEFRGGEVKGAGRQEHGRGPGIQGNDHQSPLRAILFTWTQEKADIYS